MNEGRLGIEHELSSIERKSDQACSIHAMLRNRYALYAGFLDYGLMLSSTYLLGVSFIEPTIGASLSFGFDRQFLIAILTFVLFALSIAQFKNDWRKKEQAHQRSCAEYAKVKATCRQFTSGTTVPTEHDYQRVRVSYDLVSDIGTHIPDKEFAKGKAHHKRKVFISQYLDSHPGALPSLIKLKLFLRDNFGINFLD